MSVTTRSYSTLTGLKARAAVTILMTLCRLVTTLSIATNALLTGRGIKKVSFLRVIQAPIREDIVMSIHAHITILTTTAAAGIGAAETAVE